MASDIQQCIELLSKKGIDFSLVESKPPAPVQPSIEEIKRDLQDEFLVPPTKFSEKWLNILQRPPNVDLEQYYDQLYSLPASMSRTQTRFIRSGLQGQIIGYEEYVASRNQIEANAKNSGSLTRQIIASSSTDYIKGKSGFVPFTPGGIESVASNTPRDIGKDISMHQRDQDGLLSAAMGMPRGLDEKLSSHLQLELDNDNQKQQQQLEQEVSLIGDLPPDLSEEEDLDLEDVSEIQSCSIVATPPKSLNGDKSTIDTPDGIDLDAIDDLLPVEDPYADMKLSSAALSSTSTGTRNSGKNKEWAHVVELDHDLPNFSQLVPDMARKYPFELDIFQKEAIYHLEQGDSVFVAAHTSAGKTVVAEYAIAMANRNMTKSIYTSPIKALSNQKFRDFKKEFNDDVGIFTGDVQINPEASCLIMTTEILRSMLYRAADVIRDVEFVIFDEVHYVNDMERGVVWEEVIIMLPEHVKLILLSATVPNTMEFASWVGRTKRKDIYVISTPKRPVPLEHFIYTRRKLIKIVDEHKRFLEDGYKQVQKLIDPAKFDQPKPGQQQQGRGGGQSRGRGDRGRGGRGRGGPMGGGYPRRQGGGSDKGIYLSLVQHLHSNNLLPGVIFVFSKKRCEEYAESLTSIDYCTAKEKSEIHLFADRALSRLKKEDRNLPQILRLRELLSRGIAVHHGGLLPIAKEIVEILFARTLVKVLFATETFAMGLNLPTKTVAFSGMRKHDGRSFRNLLAGEYTQMAGRAGRRGLDTIGTVILIASGDQPPSGLELKTMMLGTPTKLQSQFRLTYNMILNLLRVEALKVEDMIKRSFSENTTQALLPEHLKSVKAQEFALKNLIRISTDIDDYVRKFHTSTMEWQENFQKLITKASQTPVGRQIMNSHVAVFQAADLSRSMGIILRLQTNPDNQTIVTMLTPWQSIQRLNNKRGGSDNNNNNKEILLPFHPSMFARLRPFPHEERLVRVEVPLSSIEYITKTIIITGSNTPGMFRMGNNEQQARKSVSEISKELNEMGKSINGELWESVSWDKMKNIEFHEYLNKYKQAGKEMEIESKLIIKDSRFPQVYKEFHQEYIIQDKIKKLKSTMSDENLELLPDYEQRIELLKELEFIDKDSNVVLKGRVACEINSGYELILTELILDNFLNDYEPQEIAALLSAFIFEEKSNTDCGIVTPRLGIGKKKIMEISQKVYSLQDKLQISTSTSQENPFETDKNFYLMEVVYEWARGMSFNNITGLTDVYEGTIVRVITRLDEVCREVKNAARIIGDANLYTKMQSSQDMIKRDIVFCASLYV